MHLQDDVGAVAVMVGLLDFGGGYTHSKARKKDRVGKERSERLGLKVKRGRDRMYSCCASPSEAGELLHAAVSAPLISLNFCGV
jgi:hypothetical protein